MKAKHFMKISIWVFTVFVSLTFLNSCKRSYNYSNGSTTVFDNSKTTQGTILGQVVKEDGSPLKDVVVKVGSNTYTTGNDGVFYFSKITTQQNATLITATKSNYMNGYRTIKVNTNKDHYTRIMMIELKNPVTFNSITGGVVNVSGGGTITFPSDAVVYKNSGAQYSGTVNVYAKWLDPTANRLNELMPGDLRAIDASNIEQILSTFGMMGVELFDNAGAPLQIAPAKTAQLSFPIPASLSSAAPASIPLWFFDATSGMWKEEGSATKKGNNYVGDVHHFSFWNCDIQGPYVNFEATIVEASTLNPLANLHVRVTNPLILGQAHGYTNGSGYVSGNIPANSSLVLEVISAYPCSNVIYSQNITTGSTPLNLGTIAITIPPANQATITGSVLNCLASPVANGYVAVDYGSSVTLIPTNTSGGFTTSAYLCTPPSSATITAYDMSAAESGTITTTLVSGMNNLGILSACGNPFQFINWTSTVGTTATNSAINEPFGFFYGSYSSTTGLTTITCNDSLGAGGFKYISFTFNGLDAVSGLHTIASYQDHLENGPSSPVTSIPVTITDYQVIGGYISGSFTGDVSGGTIPLRTISCNFKIKRQ